jgi:Two component regulator propeller
MRTTRPGRSGGRSRWFARLAASDLVGLRELAPTNRQLRSGRFQRAYEQGPPTPSRDTDVAAVPSGEPGLRILPMCLPVVDAIISGMGERTGYIRWLRVRGRRIKRPAIYVLAFALAAAAFLTWRVVVVPHISELLPLLQGGALALAVGFVIVVLLHPRLKGPASVAWVFFLALIAGVSSVPISPSPSPLSGTPTAPTLTQPATIALATDTPPEVGLCGSGQPISVTIPMGPGNFDNQFGYTFYNTNNSHELALNAIRSLLADENGLWVGYGGISNVGRGGVSFVGHDISGARLWEYCTNIPGKPIGRLSNDLAKAKNNALWVATDGDGVWRLQGGKWEQFIYDASVNDAEPSAVTYAIAANDNTMLVGTSDGITRWTGATWERVLYSEQVVALAVDARGVWVGYPKGGVSLNPWESNPLQDYNVAKGDLASDAVRTITIDTKGRVWVGTDGGGLSVFDNGKWSTYLASNSGLLSDTVKAVAVDEYDRVWVGTSKGTSYFDGKKWYPYTTVPTTAIAFARVPHDPCSPDDTVWDVWIGTDDKGILNSRLPANSPVVANVSVSDVPATLRPGQTFTPSVTITLEDGYGLTQGDFLQTLDVNSYTPNPLVGLPKGLVVKGGVPYTFSFKSNPMKAPEQNGAYSTTWRLWQCGRYVGQPIKIDFTVSNP